MEVRQVTRELLDVVQSLPAERQEQLLKLARNWASRELSSAGSRPRAAESPLVERNGVLFVSARLEGPWVDHRQIRDERLSKLSGLES